MSVYRVHPRPWPVSRRPCLLSLACAAPRYFYGWGCPRGPVVKNPPTDAGDAGLIPGREDPLEKGTAAHASIVAWRIPWTEEPGGLCS